MSFQMDKMEKDGVKLEYKDAILYISGIITSQKPGEFLDPYFTDFNEKAAKSGLKEITVDIRELSYLNSAGIRSLVDWILAMEELPADKKYKINILCSSQHQWQKTSINSLTFLSPSLVTKKEV